MAEMLFIITYAYLAIGALFGLAISFIHEYCEAKHIVNTILFWPLVLLTLFIVQVIDCIHTIKKAGGK